MIVFFLFSARVWTRGKKTPRGKMRRIFGNFFKNFEKKNPKLAKLFDHLPVDCSIAALVCGNLLSVNATARQHCAFLSSPDAFPAVSSSPSHVPRTELKHSVIDSEVSRMSRRLNRKNAERLKSLICPKNVLGKHHLNTFVSVDQRRVAPRTA